MHLLAAKPGAIADGSEAVDLGQTPGDIVFSRRPTPSSPASPQAQRRRGDRRAQPAPRQSAVQLGHNLSVDLYVEPWSPGAKLVVVRLLGGARYWPYGVEQLDAVCRERGIALALLPGDDQPDPELRARSTLPADGARTGSGAMRAGRHRERASSLLGYAASADRP